ncbi:hypothetical protein ATCCBAA256_34160 [Mycobacterium montefiorense]|nr:hypothetical protein ATCCBAA256_34160 [Mycobacterium montefiorense]
MFNAADYLVDRHLREGRGTRTAVVSSTRTLNYQGLALEVHRVAGGLQKLGVRREDRVMLCMVDDVELLTGILATIYLGAIAIPVSTMLSGPELGKLVADAHVRIVCASTEFVAAIAIAPRWPPMSPTWCSTASPKSAASPAPPCTTGTL